MGLVFAYLGIAMAAVPAEQQVACGSYVGQRPATVSFDELRASLPSVAAKSQFETTAQYEARLAGSASNQSRPFIVRRNTVAGDGLSYDADKGVLTVWPTALGARRVNFTNVFGHARASSREDNSFDAIGLLVATIDVARSSYEASNAFGAARVVEHTKRRLLAVWERPGRRGESIFSGAKGSGPVAQLKMSSAAARDLIERGGSAVLLVPKPPFVRQGRAALEPSITSPLSREDEITTIAGNIQCVFLLDSSQAVAAAFPVK
jgi:hypothetical protein